jgi:hypothetical protein
VVCVEGRRGGGGGGCLKGSRAGHLQYSEDFSLETQAQCALYLGRRKGCRMLVHMITHATVGWVKENATTAEGALRLRCGYGAAPDTLDLWNENKGGDSRGNTGTSQLGGRDVCGWAFEKMGLKSVDGWVREVRYSIGSGSGQARGPPPSALGGGEGE